MTTRNDITGDSLTSRGPSKEYLTNYDRIFGKGKEDEKDTTSSVNASTLNVLSTSSSKLVK